MFGITDPYIWGAYAACILTTAFCIIFGIVKGRTECTEEKEEADD